MVDSIAGRHSKSTCPVPDLPNNFAYTERFNAVFAYTDANLEGDLLVKT